MNHQQKNGRGTRKQSMQKNTRGRRQSKVTIGGFGRVNVNGNRGKLKKPRKSIVDSMAKGKLGGIFCIFIIVGIILQLVGFVLLYLNKKANNPPAVSNLWPLFVGLGVVFTFGCLIATFLVARYQRKKEIGRAPPGQGHRRPSLQPLTSQQPSIISGGKLHTMRKSISDSSIPEYGGYSDQFDQPPRSANLSQHRFSGSYEPSQTGSTFDLNSTYSQQSAHYERRMSNRRISAGNSAQKPTRDRTTSMSSHY